MGTSLGAYELNHECAIKWFGYVWFWSCIFVHKI